MKVICFALKKGGVSKTTSAFVTALILAIIHKFKVLLIDSDSQNALTSLFFDDIDEIENRTILEALKGEIPFNESIFHMIDNLDVIPAKTEFNEINDWKRPGKDLILRRLLRGLDYDYVIIDTGPYDNTEVNLGLAAAHKVIIPVKLEEMDTRAIGFTLTRIEEIKEDLNPDLQETFILPTQKNYQNRTIHELQLRKLKKEHPDKTLDFEIPYTSKISLLHLQKMEGLEIINDLDEYKRLVEVIK